MRWKTGFTLSTEAVNKRRAKCARTYVYGVHVHIDDDRVIKRRVNRGKRPIGPETMADAPTETKISISERRRFYFWYGPNRIEKPSDCLSGKHRV